MTISIHTKIDGSDPIGALSKFDRSFFEALSPSFPKLTIEQFDGSFPGDIVDITLDIYLAKLRWKSEITERSENPQEAYFIDEGRILPWFLKSWKHQHIIRKVKDQLILIDHINYQSPFIILTFLIYPLFYLQFASRKSVYRSWFKS